MAEAATDRGYEYIAITDHSPGTQNPNGLGPAELQRQRCEIDNVNDTLGRQTRKVFVLQSIEMNLNPQGEGDMETGSLRELDLVLGCFHSSMGKRKIKPSGIWQRSATRLSRFWAIRAAEFITIVWA
jgi:DNA polymerase (family 10)